MILIYKLLLALLPVLLMLYYVYHKGEGNQILSKVLVASFIGGFMLMLPTHLISIILYEVGLYTKGDQTVSETLWRMFITGAMLEELLKFGVFIVTLKFAYKPRGGGVVVIAAFVGLGFASDENLLYIMTSDNWVATGIARALLSVTDHFSYGVVMGALYFYAYHCHKAGFIVYPLALILPISLHWLGNAILITPALDEWDIVLAPVWSITLFVLACRLIKKTCEISGQMNALV